MIESIYLSELGLATKGILRGEDIAFPSVAIDTRTLTAGELYIALQGEQFDGHQFVRQVMNLIAEIEQIPTSKHARISGSRSTPDIKLQSHF